MASKYISVKEMCDMLDISKTAGYNLVKNGSIEAYRVGSSIKIPRTAVKKYLKSSLCSTPVKVQVTKNESDFQKEESDMMEKLNSVKPVY